MVKLESQISRKIYIRYREGGFGVGAASAALIINKRVEGIIIDGGFYSKHEITLFPKAILKLRFLRLFYLRHTRIKQIPEELSNLRLEKTLIYDNKELKEIPEAIKKLEPK